MSPVPSGFLTFPVSVFFILLFGALLCFYATRTCQSKNWGNSLVLISIPVVMSLKRLISLQAFIAEMGS